MEDCLCGCLPDPHYHVSVQKLCILIQGCTFIVQYVMDQQFQAVSLRVMPISLPATFQQPFQFSF